ncbi:MAG: DUF502 domain-containing protein [Phycisphaerales bacterium]|nr:DUF502 domain-containing protein [Phycisphaerales bacterium]
MVEEPNNQSAAATGGGEPRAPRRLWPAFLALLRTRIVTGILIVIPILVTWYVVSFVFNTMRMVTEPVAWKIARQVQEGQPLNLLPQGSGRMERELISRVLTRAVEQDMSSTLDQAERQAVVDRLSRKLVYLLRDMPDVPVGTPSEVYLQWIIPIAAVLLTLLMLYMLGLMGASVLGRRVIRLFESIFERVPLVKTIYKSTKQIVVTLGGGQAMEFQRVVLVEFPRPGMKCVAFLTSVMKDVDTGREMATVFISTTPNPTTGYMQIVPLEELSETNWTVEDAVKLLMSGGVISPPRVAFDKVRPVRWAGSDKRMTKS